MLKRFLIPLIESLKSKDPGLLGAFIGGGLGLGFIIFGIWRSLFILLMAALGYTLGVSFFGNKERIRRFLDLIFPPGRYH